MLDILINIKNLLVSMLNNENYINCISILVVAITSYKVAGYNASKPNKIRVKQLQLDNVYLPLFRIVENIPNNLTRKKAIYIHKKISNILDANYELVFPQLHQLNKNFGYAILKNADYSKYFHRIKHQVSTDYELLKKTLGYPSENFFNIFIRMTFKQKITFIISWLNIIWVFGPMFFTFIFINPESPYDLVGISLFIFIVSFYPIMKINEWVKRLED